MQFANLQVDYDHSEGLSSEWITSVYVTPLWYAEKLTDKKVSKSSTPSIVGAPNLFFLLPLSFRLFYTATRLTQHSVWCHTRLTRHYFGGVDRKHLNWIQLILQLSTFKCIFLQFYCCNIFSLNCNIDELTIGGGFGWTPCGNIIRDRL